MNKIDYHTKHIRVRYQLTKHNLANIDKQFIVWLAGFYEGEGNIYGAKGGYELSISQNEKLVLEKIKDKLNIGSITKVENWYLWEVNNLGDILVVIEKIIPYLQTNKRKIQFQNFLKLKRVIQVRE